MTVRSPLVIFPLEIWREIASYLFAESRGAGEQWQLASRAMREQEDPSEPLDEAPVRAFSQTCTVLRDETLKDLWRNVEINSTFLDIRLGFILQLNVSLANPDIARHVESIAIRSDLALDTFYSSSIQHEWWEGARIAAIFKKLEEFHYALNILSDRLELCPRLTTFTWSGGCRPINPFYDKLARAPRLKRVRLDYGKIRVARYDAMERKGLQIAAVTHSSYPVVSALRDSTARGYTPDSPDDREAEDYSGFARCIVEADLGFGSNKEMREWREGMHPNEGMCPDVRQECSRLYTWLTSPNELRILRLAALILYWQPWMVSMWAQVCPIQVPNTGVPDSEFGEWLQGIDEPYTQAAQAFRSILIKRTDAKQRQAADKANETLTVEEVHTLIMKTDELSMWRKWFPSLDWLDTRAILGRVLEFKAKARGDAYEKESQRR